MGLVSDIIDKLYKREVNKSNFKSYFEKVDLDNFFNHLSYYIDPNEMVMKIGDRQVLEKLYYDGEIFSAVDKRLGALKTTKLVLESENSVVQDFMEKQILPHQRQLKQDFWWAIPYGYSVEQIIYNEDRSGSVAGFRKEDFWRFTPMQDQIHVRVQSSINPKLNNTVLDYGKWVLTTNNGSANKPTGDAMFSRLYLPWMFKCESDDLLMRFLNRFALGFLVGKTPDPEDVEILMESLKKAAKGSAMAVTTNDSIEYLQPSRDSSMFQAVDHKINNLFYRVILGETQTSVIENRGSSQSAEIHNGVRLEKTLDDVHLVENAFEETMRQIAAVNGIAPELVPSANLIYDQGLEPDRAARDHVLASTGQLRFTKEYWQRQYGFEDDEIEIVDPAPANPFGNFSQKKSKQTFLSSSDIKKYLDQPEDNCKTCDGVHGE